MDGAINWVKSLNYCGHSDWRLPTKKELVVFSKQGGKRPYTWFNANGFNNVQANFYWSPSTCLIIYAWVINMNDGSVDGGNKTFDFYVWPVRGGQ